MTERVIQFSPDQIGTGAVRFSRKGVFETHKDHMVDPYAATRVPKEAQIEGSQFWPQAQGQFPAVVMLHERWGLTSQIKNAAQRLACEGYVVLAPNLYGRQGGMVTANAEVATALMERMDMNLALQDINACCEFLNVNLSEDTTLEHTKRNVHAIVGFGLGGTLALRFACNRKRLRGAVAFYGNVPSPIEALEQAFCPIQYHAAEDDEWVSAEEWSQLEAVSQQSEKGIHLFKHPHTTHGFCNEMRTDTYHDGAANSAWETMVEFLRKSLVTS